MFDLSVPRAYFVKRAKELQSGVQTKDADAIRRVRSVYRAADEMMGDFGLMRAQHVVAVEHGFETWNALTTSSGVEARLALTMARVPDLNDLGLGTWWRYGPTSREDFAEQRRKLRRSVSDVASTIAWLQKNVAPRSTINTLHTSYGLKHMAEKDIGYVTNGVFIAAGIIAGYTYQLRARSPNVPFGMSEKSLKAIAKRHLQER